MLKVSISRLNKISGEFENISNLVIDYTIERYISLISGHKEGIVFIDLRKSEKSFQRLVIDNLHKRQFLITVDQIS